MQSENVSSADNQQERPCYTLYNEESSEAKRQTSYKQLATLLGLLFTDGCVSRKGNSWRIYFGVKSYTLIMTFSECICSVFNLSSERVRIYKRNSGIWVAIVNSKDIGNYLVNNFGTFRTLKFDNGMPTNARLPIKFLLTNNLVTNFLSAAFSCDGGVCFYKVKTVRNGRVIVWMNRNIFLACVPSTLRVEYSILLNELGIKHVNSEPDKKIKIHSKREIYKFANLIGFIPDVEVTDHSIKWRGYPKAGVLEMLMASYIR